MKAEGGRGRAYTRDGHGLSPFAHPTAFAHPAFPISLHLPVVAPIGAAFCTVLYARLIMTYRSLSQPQSRALALGPWRTQLYRTGYLYLPALPNSFDWVQLAAQLTQGQLLMQDHGDRIYDVRPTAQALGSWDAKSTSPLRPHTDGPHLAMPPHWLALYGVRDAACGGGYTQLTDGWELLRWQFSLKEQRRLMQQRYPFRDKSGTHQAIAPLIEPGRGGSLRWRYSQNCLRFGEPSPDLGAIPAAIDPWVQTVTDRIADFCRRCHLAIRLQPGSLLLWDNHRMLHYRTAFTDPNRHLQRLWLGDGKVDATGLGGDRHVYLL